MEYFVGLNIFGSDDRYNGICFMSHSVAFQYLGLKMLPRFLEGTRGPNHVFIRNRKCHVIVGELVVKILSSGPGMGVPSANVWFSASGINTTNVIVHRYPGIPVCHKPVVFSV